VECIRAISSHQTQGVEEAEEVTKANQNTHTNSQTLSLTVYNTNSAKKQENSDKNSVEAATKR